MCGLVSELAQLLETLDADKHAENSQSDLHDPCRQEDAKHEDRKPADCLKPGGLLVGHPRNSAIGL